MELYIETTDEIVNIKNLIIGTIDKDVSKLSSAELKAVGRYKVNYEDKPNSRYYTYSPVYTIDVDDICQVTYPPVAKLVSDVQKLLIASIENTANTKFNELTVGYTPAEMSSWCSLEVEALSHSTTPLTSGMIVNESTASGVHLDDLVLTILTKATTLKEAKSYISGTRKKKVLEVEVLSFDECILYESTPYDYVITADDVLLDDTLVQGAVIPKFKNLCTDWS